MWILQFDLNKTSIEELDEIYKEILKIIPEDVIAIPNCYQLNEYDLKELEQIKNCVDFAIEKEKEKNDKTTL